MRGGGVQGEWLVGGAAHVGTGVDIHIQGWGGRRQGMRVRVWVHEVGPLSALDALCAPPAVSSQVLPSVRWPS